MNPANPCFCDIDVIHHLGIIARDLSAVAKTYESLGFTLTPVSEPRIPLTAGAAPSPIGVGNRCAIFGRNYLELLGVIDAERWQRISVQARGPFNIDPPLSRHEGLHVLHLGCDDIDVAHERTSRDGLRPSAIRPFSRMVDTDEGDKTMHARSFSLPGEFWPEALVQVAQHLTPELIFQERYQSHPNGARELLGVTLCVSDVESVARRYAMLSGVEPRVGKRGLEVVMDHSRIEVVGISNMATVSDRFDIPIGDFLAGMTLSANLTDTETFLRSASINHHADRNCIRLDEGLGGGAFIEFVQA